MSLWSRAVGEICLYYVCIMFVIRLSIHFIKALTTFCPVLNFNSNCLQLNLEHKRQHYLLAEHTSSYQVIFFQAQTNRLYRTKTLGTIQQSHNFKYWMTYIALLFLSVLYEWIQQKQCVVKLNAVRMTKTRPYAA